VLCWIECRGGPKILTGRH